MSSTRFVWLAAMALCVALVAGCSGGSEPAAESETAEGTPPEGGSAEEAEMGSEAGESGVDIPTGAGPVVVELNTSAGAMKLELYPDKAPKTVENFLAYVRNGFYDDTIFHRVKPGFVIQGGGFTPDMVKKETDGPIENEADNGLRNVRGSICMARTNDPHSATSQFFINTVDNPALDYRDRSIQGWGYAVFGKVVEGIEVMEQIERVPTTSREGYQDVPVDAVVIETARIIG